MSKKTWSTLVVGISVVVISLLLPTFSVADSWSTPSSLISGYNWYGNAAVNSRGDAMAVWLSSTYPYQILSSQRNAGGSTWSSPLVVGTAPGAPWPQIFLDEAGNALAVWNDSPGIFTASLRSGATRWAAPQLMTSSTMYPNIAMDTAGDAILVWISGGGLYSRTKPVGGNWGATILSAPCLSGYGLTNPIVKMSNDGSVVLAYQTYLLNNRRRAYNFQIYTARRNALSGIWQAPVAVGRVTPPSQVINGHQIGVAVDAAGNAILVADQLTTQNYGLLESAVQRAHSTVWSTSVSITSAGANLAGAVSDNSGNVSVVYQTVPGSNGVVMGISGNLLSNAWGATTQISSGSVYAWKPGLSGNRSGEVIASWFVYDPVNYTNLKLQTATLPNPGAAWKASKDLFVKGSNYTMTSPIIGIDGQGKAVAVWDVTATMGFPHIITTADYTP